MIHSVSFKYALMSHSISIIHRYIEIGHIVWLYVSANFFFSCVLCCCYVYFHISVVSYFLNAAQSTFSSRWKPLQAQPNTNEITFPWIHTYTRWQLRTHAKTHVCIRSEPKSAPSMPQTNNNTTTMFQKLPLAFLTLTSTSMCWHSIEL